MNISMVNYKRAAAAWMLMLAVAVQAQEYGALKYMLQKRPANERFESNKFNEHLFFSAGGGVHGLLTDRGSQDGPGAVAKLAVGKWLTPVHGLRLGASVGYLPSAVYGSKNKMVGLDLDYLLNISSLTFGYDEHRRFELWGIAGIGGGYSQSNDERTAAATLKGTHYGLRVGMQGNLRLSPTLDLFVEPTVGWYDDGFTHTETWRNYQTDASLLLGLTYMPAAVMGRKIHFDTFDKRSLLNHCFISLSAGVSTLKAAGIRNTIKNAGPQFSAGIGKWVAPSSGWRLSATVGFSNTPAGSESRYFKHVDVQADYLLNVNNVLWGYDEDRLFTLVGMAGIHLAGTKGIETKARYAPGIGVGVQGSFRLNHSVDLFVEPSLTVYHKRYAGGCGWKQSDQLGALSLGLNYHTVDRADRPSYTFARNHVADHLFMTSGVGAQLFLNKTNLKNAASAGGPQLSLSLGKWLSPSSGVRLVGAGGFFTNYAVPASVAEGRVRHIGMTGGLDYLWNITTTMSGYRPERMFDLVGFAGAHLAYTSRAEHKLQPGIDAGVQGIWHVNDFFGLFVEPQVRLYADKFIEGNVGFLQKDVMVGVNAGFHYRFVPYSKSANRAAFGQDEKRYFVSGALGVGSLLVANKDLVKKAGVEAKGSFGKWYTPLSAWRVNGTLLYKSETPRGMPLHYAGVGMDYMMSLAALAKGYRSGHVVDVLPFAGVTAGLVRRNGEFRVVPGVDAGVQVQWRVASDFSLYAEPQVGIRTDAYDGYRQGRPDRVASFVVGLHYRFKMPDFQ